MPYVLKQRTSKSPGIISFTHNELLYGVIAKSSRIKKYLSETSKIKEWLYGIHIQGNCSGLKEWPLEGWQSFIMWPDTTAPFLKNVPPGRVLPLNCINFMPDMSGIDIDQKKIFDICVISKPSKIKRIEETIRMIRLLMDRKPDLKVVIIAPDPRRIALGEKAYPLQDVDRSFFELPRKIFTSREMENISFICSSQESFGNFPLAPQLLHDILAKSKFLMLTSHLEGVPRVLAESALLGVPCIISKSLDCGILSHFHQGNSIKIDDDIRLASNQVLDGLNHYQGFFVDVKAMRQAFDESCHLPAFKGYLSKLIQDAGKEVEGNWYLSKLHLRLACHGHKHNFQFLNSEKLFFDWLKKNEGLDEFDEDKIFGEKPLDDRIALTPRNLSTYARNKASSLKRKLKNRPSTKTGR